MSEKRSCCCGALPALWWWLLTLLGLPLLFWLMISSKQNTVETDLAARATNGLQAASLGGVQVNLDKRGRDAQLSGTVNTEAEREQAIKLVQDTYGIRVVENNLQVNTNAVAPVASTNAAEVLANLAAPSFSLLPEAGKWVLKGALSSQSEVDQAVAGAEKVYGAGNVLNQLTVGQNLAPATWISSLGNFADVLSGIKQSGLSFANGIFTLSGEVASEAMKTESLAKAQQLLGGVVESQLKVTAASTTPSTDPAMQTVNTPTDITPVPAATAPMSEAASKNPEPTSDTAMPATSENPATTATPAETAATQPATTAPANDTQVAATTTPTEPNATLPASTAAPASTTAVTAVEPSNPAAADATTANPAADTTAPATASLAVTPSPATESSTEKPTIVEGVLPSPTATSASSTVAVVLNPQQQSCQNRMNEVMTGQQILFETNKAIIKRNSLRLLNQIAAIVNECQADLADKLIQVGGHTDSLGPDIYNQDLSQRRADAVKAYLVKVGLAADLVKSVGYGETTPIASNATEAGRAQNRRISFEIIQK